LVIPDFRYNEIKSFVERGLEDFSISRLKSKMSWGIPVPDDSLHVMYVWFDALVNYVSAIGWPHDQRSFEKWAVESGGMVQYCGKDNLRQQSAIWQAMLMAADLPPSQTIIINGFVTGEGGIKMSKSLGNTVDPFELVKEYGTDAVRYFVVRELHPFEDSPFSTAQFKDAYNAHLANGLGNLVSRIMKMAAENLENPVKYEPSVGEWYETSLEAYDLKTLCEHIWKEIQETDTIIQKEQPFKVVKTDQILGKQIITDLLKKLSNIAFALRAVMPQTALLIEECITNNTMPLQPLFIRKL
jgi:methionyl-tRNA synthetase